MIKFDDQLSSSSSIVDVVDSCSRSLTTPVVVVEVHGSQQQEQEQEQEEGSKVVRLICLSNESKWIQVIELTLNHQQQQEQQEYGITRMSKLELKGKEGVERIISTSTTSGGGEIVVIILCLRFDSTTTTSTTNEYC
jgi:hypothetical protein